MDLIKVTTKLNQEENKSKEKETDSFKNQEENKSKEKFRVLNVRVIYTDNIRKNNLTIKKINIQLKCNIIDVIKHFFIFKNKP